VILGKIQIHAGDLETGSWNIGKSARGTIISRASTEMYPLFGEKYTLNDVLRTAEQLDEQSVRSLAGAAGWGFIGTVALGPLGLVGGAVFGARQKRKVTFAAEFVDGSKVLATTDPETWRRIHALVWDKERLTPSNSYERPDIGVDDWNGAPLSERKNTLENENKPISKQDEQQWTVLYGVIVTLSLLFFIAVFIKTCS
jgi:hypothetical protein